MMTVNRPVKFLGTREQAQANFATHEFVQIDMWDYRCHKCDCKPHHVAADYPCGEEPPRETVVL